jgi:hypothetical protein
MSEDQARETRHIDVEEAEADAADLGQLAHRWYHLAEAATGQAGADPRSTLVQIRDELFAALVWIGDDPRKLSEEGRTATLVGAETLARQVAANLAATEDR